MRTGDNTKLCNLFDTLPADFVPRTKPPGGTTYLYVWNEEDKKGEILDFFIKVFSMFKCSYIDSVKYMFCAYYVCAYRNSYFNIDFSPLLT